MFEYYTTIIIKKLKKMKNENIYLHEPTVDIVFNATPSEVQKKTN